MNTIKKLNKRLKIMNEILRELTDLQLIQLNQMIEKNIHKKRTISLLVSSMLFPVACFAIYNDFNGNLVWKLLLGTVLLVSIIRFTTSQQILELISYIVIGLFNLSLLLLIGIDMNLLTLIFFVMIYYYGVKVTKKIQLKNYINNNIANNKTENKTLGFAGLATAIALMLSDNISNIILILGSYIISMFLVCNVFNPYYLKEIKEELMSRK